MPDPDNVAGYKDILTGSHDAPAQGGGAAQIAGSSAPELKSLLGIAVGTLVIAALYFGKEVLIPITLAVMLSFVLSPVVNILQRLRLQWWPAKDARRIRDRFFECVEHVGAGRNRGADVPGDPISEMIADGEAWIHAWWVT